MADSAAVTARILELEAIGNTHVDVKEGYFAICLCVYFDLQMGLPCLVGGFIVTIEEN